MWSGQEDPPFAHADLPVGIDNFLYDSPGDITEKS